MLTTDIVIRFFTQNKCNKYKFPCKFTLVKIYFVKSLAFENLHNTSKITYSVTYSLQRVHGNPNQNTSFYLEIGLNSAELF